MEKYISDCTFQAAIKAIEQAKEQGLDELVINTDSKFLIQSKSDKYTVTALCDIALLLISTRLSLSVTLSMCQSRGQFLFAIQSNSDNSNSNSIPNPVQNP